MQSVACGSVNLQVPIRIVDIERYLLLLRSTSALDMMNAITGYSVQSVACGTDNPQVPIRIVDIGTLPTAFALYLCPGHDENLLGRWFDHTRQVAAIHK